MALVLRKANHGRMDIQGCTVAEHRQKREEQRRRREAKRRHLKQAYQAAMPTAGVGSGGGGLVHYCVGTGDEGEGGVRVEVSEGRETGKSAVQSTVCVEITQS